MRVRRPDEHDAGRERREPSRRAAPPHVARLLALQRSAGNQAVARAIKFNADEMGTIAYEFEPGDGEAQDLDAVVDEVMSSSTGLTKAAVRKSLSAYDGDEAADLVYNSIESLVGWLGGTYVSGDDTEGLEEKGEKDEKAQEDGEVQEGVRTAEGQTVGKITFEGDTYHGGIKKAIVRAIGVKTLSYLVYGDKKHHNFNFWFEEDGEIFADVNSPKNNKGIPTGWNWDVENEVATQVTKVKRKGGRTKERKGNKDSDW